MGTPCAADFELVALRNEVFSLRSKENRQTFHPGIGPVAEALAVHVTPQRFGHLVHTRPVGNHALNHSVSELTATSNRARMPTAAAPIHIWDVGLGAGANALTAVQALLDLSDPVDVIITSFDTTTAALEFATDHAHSLVYPLGHEKAIQELLTTQQATFFPSSGGRIVWQVKLADFPSWVDETTEVASPMAIFYDPYSAAVNPDMWTLDHFRNLRSLLDDEVPCLLTTYTRSTAIRTTMLLAGFFLGYGDATGEKEQTTQASNQRGYLPSPLPPAWLDKVLRSSNSAPLRIAGQECSPIRPDDLTQLQSHPQFSYDQS